MKRILLALGFVVACWLVVPTGAQAQQPVVLQCATGNPTNPWAPCPTAGGAIPITGTITASLAPFAPAGNFATLTATASSADHAIPTGSPAVVALFNTGTTAVSCTFTIGAGVAVANENIIQPSSWLGFAVGTNTHYSCINQAGDAASNVVVASGGTGLPTGSGGGGGSSSNASVSATGSAVPASATYIAINAGGTLTGWTGAVTNAGTFAVQATLQASATTAIGKVDPNTIATWGLAALGGATAPTNAIATACEYLSSAPTYTTGQTGAIQCTAAGSVHTTVDNTNANVTNASDAQATSSTFGSPVVNSNYIFNGSTWDRQRSGSVTGSALATPVPTSTAGQALSHVSGASASLTSLVAKASAGNLYAYNCTAVAGAAAGFCVAYNGTTAPSTGALTAANVLDFCYFGTTAAGCSLSRIPMGVNYSTGIVILVTSAATPYTYTTGTDTAAITADVE